jgi:ribonuclease VapC
VTITVVAVDSSILVAIFKQESDAPRLVQRLLSFDRRVISAVNFLESAIVCEDWGKPAGQEDYDKMVSSLDLEIVPATAAQTAIARGAHRQFGKGRGRPAVLNFGDCFAYALAKDLDAPLLYKGNDFAQTDIRAA